MAASRVKILVGTAGRGPMYRAFGSQDVDGNGTLCDIAHAGPFVLMDVVSIASVAGFKAPFCAHPHSGAAVCSVLMEGKEFRAWDNVRGAENDALVPGGIYMLNSGAGCVHDEKPDPISMRGCTKAVFAEGDDSAAEGFSFCQLWFNPGGLEDLAPMSSQVVMPDAVPVVTDGPLALRLLAGKYCGAESPLVLPHELIIMNGRLHGGASAELTLPAGYEGFVLLVKDSGDAEIDGQALTLKQTGVISAGDAPIRLAAASDLPVLFLLGVGVPHTSGFAKLLGYGGALLAATEEAVRAKMAVYAADPQGFGRSQVAAKEEVPDLGADLAGYAMIEGFQNQGDELAPGVKARWTIALEHAGAEPEPERAM